jgi:hypothetical protein
MEKGATGRVLTELTFSELDACSNYSPFEVSKKKKKKEEKLLLFVYGD